MTKLEILVVAYGRDIEKADASRWPKLEGVRYVVACQNPEELELDTSHLRRDDITIHFFADKGVARNRNHCLQLASAPYVMLFDADLTIEGRGLPKIIEAFDSDPSLDYLATRSIVPKHVVFPPDGHDLSKPVRFYAPISFELAFRRKSLVDNNIRFCELSGLGAGVLNAAEEDIFVWNCRHKGLRGRFADAVTSYHPGETTGTRLAAVPGVIRAKGTLMRMWRGDMGALIRIPLEAYRTPMGFFQALKHLWEGYRFFGEHRKEIVID